jgi:hypothetical protein
MASSGTPLPAPAPGPSDLAALQKAVANEVTVDQSAIALINGISSQLNKLVNQSGQTTSQGMDCVPASDLQAMTKQLNDSANALAAAVKANTPASAQH